jgi:hypothetical protein
MAPLVLASLGGALVLPALVVPRLLGPVERAWMKLAAVLGAVNTRILLTLVYVLVVTPIAWLRRLGGDPLRRELGTGAGSHLHAPGLTNSMLFARDRQLCGYCGKRYLLRDLSRDHVVPVSRGGRDTWTNTVTACRSCNTRKGGRSPEQAHMPLLYVPYLPNRHEHFILRNRRILADQMEYLLAGVPRSSRLHLAKDVGARGPERLALT